MLKSLFELSDQLPTPTFLNNAVMHTQNINGSSDKEYEAAQ